jgi:hypothetical protein
VIAAQVVEPCLRQVNDVEIGGANVVIKFKFRGPETSNVFVKNVETVAEIRMRHNRITYAWIVEIGHDHVDVKLPPLPAGFAAELVAAAGAHASVVLGVNIWSGLSLQ